MSASSATAGGPEGRGDFPAHESAGPFVIVLDRQGRILRLDPAAELLVGRRSEELAGRDLCEIFLSAADGEWVRAFLANLDEVAASERRRGSWRLGDGRLHPVAWSLVGVPIGGPLAQVLLLGVDLAGQREAENALNASEEKYRELVESINDVIFSLDGDGIIRYISPVIRSLTDHAPEEILGRPFTDFIHPYDLPAVRESFRHTIAGRLEPSEHRVFTRDGRMRWVRTFSRPVLSGGRIVGVNGVLTDITERRIAEQDQQESEKRHRALIEHGSDVVVLVDGRGVNIYASPSVRRVLGYSPEEMIGIDGFELIHPEDRDPLRRRFEELVAGLGSTATVEYRFRHADGSWRWLEGIGVNLLDEPSVRAIIVNARDVTDRRRAEEEARQRQAELAHLLRVRTVGEMAAGLAHELNQPLSAIVSYAKGCVHRLQPLGLGSEDVVTALHQIADEALRAAGIVRGLKRLVRREPPRRAPIDLNEVVRDALHWVDTEARLLAVTIELDLAEGTPPVAADRTLIEQVVLNLVRNALDAVRDVAAADRRISVRTERDRDGDLRVSVRDSGRGFAPGAGESLFAPFYTTKPDGLGMGLAISRTIVEAHGGRLSAEAEAGGGATFSFTLPS